MYPLCCRRREEHLSFVASQGKKKGLIIELNSMGEAFGSSDFFLSLFLSLSFTQIGLQAACEGRTCEIVLSLCKKGLRLGMKA